MNDPPRAWNIFHRDYRKNTEKLEIIRSISSRPEYKNIARAKENDGRWRLTRSKTMLSHPRSINVTPLVRERGIVADYYKPFFHPVLTDPPPHPPPPPSPSSILASTTPKGKRVRRGRDYYPDNWKINCKMRCFTPRDGTGVMVILITYLLLPDWWPDKRLASTMLRNRGR